MNILAPFNQKQVVFYNRTKTSWFNVCEGGKRGSKNVLDTYCFCRALEYHKNKIHLAAGVSIATARLNILDCDGFGLTNYFEGRYKEGKYKDRTCIFVDTLDGQRKVVLVSGGGKKGDEKLIKGNTYGMAIVTEVNECHPVFVQEVFDRTISSSGRKVFHDLNPKAQGHWYYKEVLDFHEKKQQENTNYGYNYGHFTIADNMSLTDEQIRTVLSTYDRNSVWYMRDILGQRKNSEGLIYPNYAKAVCKTESRPYTEFQISIDYGTQNPFAMGLYGLYNEVWYKIKEYHHSGRETNRPKTDSEYYSELEKFAGNLKIRRVIVDPSASSFITLIRKSGKFGAYKAENSVLNGIRMTATAMQQGRLKINDCCKKSIEEFHLYSWDADAVDDTPIKKDDHHCDECRYFVYTNKLAIPPRGSLM